MELNIKKQRSGFSLIELLITVAILGLLSAIALPSYQEYVDSVDQALAEADIALIDGAIARYYIDANGNPPSLAEAGMAGLLDPWDNPYQYLRIDENTNNGAMRKDKNLVPVNTDYDLYSMGKNGVTAMPFTSGNGRDDIVRANNGQYIGLAEDY